MTQPRHFLPDGVRDLTPPAAEQLERLRRRLLDDYMLRGYDFVNPPLIEYADALASGAASDLKRHLVYLAEDTDTATTHARLALRADFTPQVARFDSISASSSQEVRRYCYAGSILLRQPRSFSDVRNPMQLGAELLGSNSPAADEEILALLLDSLLPVLGDTCQATLHLSDNRIIQQLCQLAGLGETGHGTSPPAPAELRSQVLSLLQRRSLNQLAPLLDTHARQHNRQYIQALVELPGMFGDLSLTESTRWQQLAALDSTLADILSQLAELARAIAIAHPQLAMVVDLADMSGYAYHNALTFTFYCGHSAVAQGGRYDGIGDYFGRSRAAIGFSINMDALHAQLPDPEPTTCVWVESALLPEAKDWVRKARQAGKKVICALSAHEQPPACCTHALTINRKGDKDIQPIT